jgi:predicted amino acid dehydrogenase
MAMPEDYLYDRLIQYTKAAQKRGAAIAGLGAYTKVAGDAGVTVAKHSPIPVTNGNSYSASTTLWAAHVMMDKIGINSLDPRNRGDRRKAKAMVIGATGSIGRVSSLLVSLVVDELVLVAQRPDKLLELREEIQKMNPRIKVLVTTQANTELASTDLIVTSTSNTKGSVLDVSKVKPGAVICDCSRPLDITAAEAASRPDVMVIQSGEVELPGNVQISCDIGLPKPTVYACLAETILLAMDGRFENFSLSKTLSMRKVKEIYQIGVKHGAELSAIQGHEGVVTDDQILRCRELALTALAGRPTDRRPRGPAIVPSFRTEEDHPAGELILPFSSVPVDHNLPEA